MTGCSSGGGGVPAAHTHPASGISDSTATGRAVLTAATQTDARTAIGAGTSSLVVGTGAGDAKAGNYQPTAANISDSTATGRAVVTATDAAAARSTLALGTAATTDAADYATAVAVEGKLDARLPLPATGVPVSIYDAATNVPYWLGRDRQTIYRGGGSTLKTSTNDGATWVTATTFSFSPYIVGVRDLANGEVIVATAASGGTPGKLYVSTGFGTPGVTWTKKLDAGAGGVGPSSYFSGHWGMSTHENIALVCEYGLQNPPTDSARFVYLSQDSGATWTQIFDLGTSASSHMHCVFYDPWWKAIWIANGDLTNRAVRVSFDMGGTWTTVDNPDNVQLVSGIAIPGCVLFGTDYQPDGIYRVERTPDRTGLSLVPAFGVAGGLTDRRRFIAGMPFWTGRQGDPILFPFITDTGWTDSAKLVATLDGYAFTTVWTDTHTYLHKGLWKMMGPTVTGAYVGELEDDRGWVKSLLKLSYLPQLRTAAPTQVTYVTGRAGAGTYTAGNIVTIGDYAKHTRADAGTSLVAGGAPNYENVVGGNISNVDTATSNLTGAPTLTSENGNWNFIHGGYDTVVNGWANCVTGFHTKVDVNANHCTIGGGSRNTANAAASYGTIGGGTGGTIDGASATIGGGSTNTATGNNSTVAGGNTNQATASASTIGGGSTNTATGNTSTVAGGYSNTASALSSSVIGGQTNAASGVGSTVPGGRSNYAQGDYSSARGYGSIATQYGEDAHASIFFAAPGDAQSSSVQLFRQTTDATASDLRINNAAPPTCPENTTWMVRAMVVARRTDTTGDNAAWTVTGTYKRDVGNTGAWVGTPTVTSVGASAGAATWTVTTGSYSVGNPRIIVTGEAAKTIRWVSKFEVVQVQQPTTATWAATTAYTLGQRVLNDGATLQCVTAGTTAGTAPTNPTAGLTVADGAAVWLRTA